MIATTLPVAPTGTGESAVAAEREALTPPGTSRTFRLPLETVSRTAFAVTTAVPSASPPKSVKERLPPEAEICVPGADGSTSVAWIAPSVVATV